MKLRQNPKREGRAGVRAVAAGSRRVEESLVTVSGTVLAVAVPVAALVHALIGPLLTVKGCLPSKDSDMFILQFPLLPGCA